MYFYFTEIYVYHSWK